MRDLQASTTTLVSRATGADGAKGNAAAPDVAISADGRFVAFSSEASNLHPDDGDDDPDVFVRDLQTNTTTLVSRATGAAGAKGDGDSFDPAISADGRFVAFESTPTNLARRRRRLRQRRVRARPADEHDHAGQPRHRRRRRQGRRRLRAPAISADGRFVAFVSAAVEPGPRRQRHGDGRVRARPADEHDHAGQPRHRRRRRQGERRLRRLLDLGRRALRGLRVGRLEPAPRRQRRGRDVFVRDLQTNTTTLVSRADGAGGAKGNGPSVNPAISADGRFVAFASTASNLHPDDSDRLADVFVRDLRTQPTRWSAAPPAPTASRETAPPGVPLISADGRFVAFQSTASNLHPDDGDTIEDLFRRDVLGPPPPPHRQRRRRRRRLHRLLCQRR